MSLVAINDIVDFQLIETGYENSSFKNCKYLGEVPFVVALGMDKSINGLHDQFYSYFKTKYPDYKNPQDYLYTLVQLENGTVRAIGKPWIQESSFQVVTNQTCDIKIHNYRNFMEAPLRDLLAKLGADYTFTTTTR